MILKKLRVENFRNITEAELQPNEGINLISGENAQGKTNLIEALWLFSGQKSFRSKKEQELIKFNCMFYRLSAEFLCEDREETADISYGRERKVLKNGVSKPSLAALCGEFPMVVFSPSHLSLIKDGPAERRRFLDSAIGQLYPDYNQALAAYNKILQQRNAALCEIRENASLLDLLEIWDESLSKAGARIVQLRTRYIELLKEPAMAVYSGISSGKEAFSIKLVTSVGELEGETELRPIKEEFLTALKRMRQEDLRTGVTNVGAHRDDIEILIDGRSVRLYGSQGQQRSSVLALKLAESKTIEGHLGRMPIILLDDVMSELDSGRKRYLYNNIEGRQVFITCCEEDSFLEETKKRNKVFYIKAGALY